MHDDTRLELLQAAARRCIGPAAAFAGILLGDPE